MTGFALLLFAGLLAYLAVLVISSVFTLTGPRRRTYAWALARGLPGEPGELTPALDCQPFDFSSRGQALRAWSIVGLDPSGPVVVLTHGWADSKVGALLRVSRLAPVCSRLIAWDLPGHGESEGRSSLGLREPEDLDSLLSVLADMDRPVVLFGWSLGAGISLVVASARPEIAAVIAEAPYRLPQTPAINVARLRGGPWRFNLPLAFAWIGLRCRGTLHAWRAFDRLAFARRTNCPVLVIRGENDTISPAADAREIAAGSPQGLLTEIPGAGHNDLWLRQPACDQAAETVRDFLAGLTPRPAAPSAVSAG
ncbi:MAG: alpha/beta hydrolase [Phycisphaerales bacterium]